MCAANNQSDEFYRRELASRSQFGFPPFKRVAMLRFQHQNPTRVEKYAFETTAFVHDQMARQKKDCVLLGPSEAPLSKLKNYYRWQALMKCESARDLRVLLNLILDYAVQRKHPAQLYVDVDPVNAL